MYEAIVTSITQDVEIGAELTEIPYTKVYRLEFDTKEDFQVGMNIFMEHATSAELLVSIKK